MAAPNGEADQPKIECDCLEQALAALLQGEWSHLERSGGLRRVTCRGCGMPFLTNDRAADLCPECQERQGGNRSSEGHETGG
jgi:hypothetical protein